MKAALSARSLLYDPSCLLATPCLALPRPFVASEGWTTVRSELDAPVLHHSERVQTCMRVSPQVFCAPELSRFRNACSHHIRMVVRFAKRGCADRTRKPR